MNEKELIAQIAKEFLSIETMEVRNRDSLDFHDVHVGCLADALHAAFKVGFKAGHKAGYEARLEKQLNSD